LISRAPGVDELVARVVVRSRAVPAPEFEVVGELSAAYPGDPGIVIALLLNLVVLHRGQVLYLPAGNIHAYLRGLGIELMAASDNVLRGGLTPKHVDVPELLRVLDFRPLPVPFLEPSEPSPGVTVFRPDLPDFQLAVIHPSDGPARFAPVAESIALCTEGAVTITGSVGEVSLAKGDSVYVTSDESPLAFTGTGTVFVASSGVSGRRNEKNL
jgi:mannose-6-phosphate isomerase